MSDGGDRPPMDRNDVDHALARLREERTRATDGLLELEANWGYRLLDGARLSGATERSRQRIQATMSTLWTLLSAYERVLSDAERLRARKARPGRDELAELTRLLTGPSVELGPGDVPLARRSLLGPMGERLTLEAVVARMTPLYEETARTVAAVDAAWSALLPRLGELEEAAREVAAMLDALGRHGSPGAEGTELGRLRGELGRLGEAVRADPLSFAAADPSAADPSTADPSTADPSTANGGPVDRGPVDTGPVDGGPVEDGAVDDGAVDLRRLDRLADDFGALRTRLTQAVRIRAEHDERVRRIDAAIREVAAAEAAARAAGDVVLAKIASPGLPGLPDVAGALRDRRTALGPLRDEGRWPELAVLADELERTADVALARARRLTETISGLLDRRNELRGRLQAYKARAGRLGRAEDIELGRLYRHAHDLLWTAPCDLRAATAAVVRYQKAIRGADDD